MRKGIVVVLVLLIFIAASLAGCAKSHASKTRMLASQKASATENTEESPQASVSSSAAGASAEVLGSDLDSIDDLDESQLSSELDDLDNDLDFEI